MKHIGTVIGFVVLCGAVAVRSDEAKKTGEHKAHMAKAAAAGNSLTGCLQKGDEANTFWLTNATGGPTGVDKFELIGAPASLKMSEHIGHKIEVRGHAVGAGEAEKIEHGKMKGMAKKEEKKEEQSEHHFKVASMKHIAPTCP
jgi:hypothetical protein